MHPQRSQKGDGAGKEAGEPSTPKRKSRNSFDQRWWENNYGIGPEDQERKQEQSQRQKEPQLPHPNRTYFAAVPPTKGNRDQQKRSQQGLHVREKPAWKEAIKPQAEWQIQKEALKAKFPSGWQPRKRLSPDALDGIRALHHQDPQRYTTPVLAERFSISAEAIRRILKSSWRPTEDEQEDRRSRWERRGIRKWTEMGAKGFKPPKKWETGIRGQGNPAIKEAEDSAAAWSLLHEPALDIGEGKPLPLAERIM